MATFWFLLGALSMLAALVLMLPWLRSMPGTPSLPAAKWPLGAGALLVLVLAFVLYHWLGHPELASNPVAPSPTGTAPAADSSGTDGALATKAGSMSSAVSGLETRLAKGGGTPADWELLAKSYEFLGLPDQASRARRHELPAAPAIGETASPAAGAAIMNAAPLAAPGREVSGEVSLAGALRAKAAPGTTLFIVAKSVDSPGAPVAVFRSTVGAWPVLFRLDDSQSMLPGRNLSAAGRITIEARISKSGQAMPVAGDLQGTSGVIDPSDHKPLQILIDHEIS